MSNSIPSEDLAFLFDVVEVTKNLYDTLSTLEPVALIQAGPNVLPEGTDNRAMLMLPGLAGEAEEKEQCLDIIRHYSIRLSAYATAIVTESWRLTGTEKVQQEMNELLRAGKTMGDHPDAREVIFISMESGKGRTQHTMAIARDKGEVTLTPNNDIEFRSWHDDAKNPQHYRISDFYVPWADRLRPEVIAWATEMDREYGDPRVAQG